MPHGAAGPQHLPCTHAHGGWGSWLLRASSYLLSGWQRGAGVCVLQRGAFAAVLVDQVSPFQGLIR